MIILTQDILSTVIHPRPEKSHKGTFGRAVLVGGNEQYGGAIIMSAEAAIKSGAGLVSVVTETANHSALHARLPEAMVIDCKNKVAVNNLLKTATVILIGPGLGLDQNSRDLLTTALQQQTAAQWLVIDGSAITLFSEQTFRLNYPEHVVFTPHQMEWQRLSGLEIAEQTTMSNQLIQKRLGTSIVLKSHRTEIYTPREHYQNPLGTPAMATGGMGDTLAGMITGFLAQFDDKETALCAAVYLHSLIGETLSQDRYVVLPTEISEHISFYMKHFENHNKKRS